MAFNRVKHSKAKIRAINTKTGRAKRKALELDVSVSRERNSYVASACLVSHAGTGNYRQGRCTLSVGSTPTIATKKSLHRFATKLK